MFASKRKLFTLVGGAAVSLSVTVGIGSPAHATTGAEILVPFTLVGNTGTSVLPRTFTAGNCRQVGANQAPDIPTSRLDLEPTDIPNVYRITWRYSLYTTHTWDNDVWHATFVFRSSSGYQKFKLAFEGPKMIDGIWTGQEATNVSLTPAQLNSLALIDWIGDC